eukprot:3798284-Prymnesium_polylepis.1
MKSCGLAVLSLRRASCVPQDRLQDPHAGTGWEESKAADLGYSGPSAANPASAASAAHAHTETRGVRGASCAALPVIAVGLVCFCAGTFQDDHDGLLSRRDGHPSRVRRDRGEI